MFTENTLLLVVSFVLFGIFYIFCIVEFFKLIGHFLRIVENIGIRKHTEKQGGNDEH